LILGDCRETYIPKQKQVLRSFFNFKILKLSKIRLFVLLFLPLTLFTSSTIFKIYYESKKYHKSYIADLRTMENFLSKDYVGTNNNSYHYLKNAYSIYLTLKPMILLDSFQDIYLRHLFLFLESIAFCLL
jgi:hypothetical protein